MDSGNQYDIADVSAALKATEAELKSVIHERDVALRALEILHETLTEYPDGCKTAKCPEWHNFDQDTAIGEIRCNCKRAALSQAERELALVETVEKIEAAHEHAAESKLVFGEDKENESC